jgi:uncharacterized protein (DUF305 family)
MKRLLVVGLLSITSFLNAEIIKENVYAQEYQKINTKMHTEMNIKYTGDPDTDFILSMIPHHKGAVEMAKIQLKYGKHPSIIKLAEEVIRDQEQEILYMEEYLKDKGVEINLDEYIKEDLGEKNHHQY